MRDEIFLRTPPRPFSPPYPAGETWLTRILRQAPGWRWTFGKHYDQTWRERHGAPNKLLIRATRSSLPRSNTPRSDFARGFFLGSSSFHSQFISLARFPPLQFLSGIARKSIVSSSNFHFAFKIGESIQNQIPVIRTFLIFIPTKLIRQVIKGELS